MMNQRLEFKGVEVTGLEPATAWSQTRNATNCATPRFCGCKGTNFFAPTQIFSQLFNDSLLNKDLLQDFHRAFHLLLSMSSHQGIANQSILWSACRRNNGIDKYTIVECQSRHQECLLCIAHIEGNDWTLCLAPAE